MSVFISGPASWNHIVELDHLPDPVPHMQFALGDHETIGGTSAGKALGLAALGRAPVLYSLLADDPEGRRVAEALRASGVTLLMGSASATERHLNLMTPDGARVSLYLSAPGEAVDPPELSAVMHEAEALVLDLSAESLRLLDTARASGRPIWTDVHDYDGKADFHRSFVEAADAVFMNADGIGDPVPFLHSVIGRGASMAVCTLGGEGAVGLDASGREHHVPAVPAEVVDTNGAGDAFMAGVLDATLSGAEVPEALAAGAAHAATVLTTRHLHPVLDDILR